MKSLSYALILLLLCSIPSCKPEISSQKTPKTKVETAATDAAPQNEQELKVIKQKRLYTTKDDRSQLQNIIISKNFYKAEDDYILEYTYPYLDEKINPRYAVFNDYIKETYLNIEATENQILEDKELLCDTLNIERFRDKRIIDYKVYSAKTNVISVVLYKENYYSGSVHSTYRFECLNFDLDRFQFLTYTDFFIPGSEPQMLKVLNQNISNGIREGDLYYECWEISKGDFQAYKNNFVITDDFVEFYFDDCVICPSYTGTYSIEISLISIMHLIQNYNNEPILSSI